MAAVLTARRAQSALRRKVAIIDRKRTIGGVCVHTGTIPSKTLRQAVLYLSRFRQRTFYGQSYVLKDRVEMQALDGLNKL